MNTPHRPIDLLVVGDANPDVIVHGAPRALAYGQAEQLAGDGLITVGGSAAIFACAAARLGLRVALASLVGDDAAGRFMLDELERRGVNVSAVRRDSTADTGLTVILARGDDRAIVTAPGCMGLFEAGAVDVALIAAARHVHVSSFFLQPRLAQGMPGLLAAAREAGAGTSLDVNWDPEERWDGGLDDVLPAVDVLFLNAAEAAAISGSSDPLAGAAALHARGPLPVIKLGAAGALAHDGRRLVRRDAPVVDVVDTVGAGDTFDAGFLCARLMGWDVARALAFAVTCGTLSTRGPGGVIAQPDRDEVLVAVDGLLPPASERRT